MPWQSKAQERWGNSAAGHKALSSAGVSEWNAASKGRKLPEQVKGGKRDRLHSKVKAGLKKAFPS